MRLLKGLFILVLLVFSPLGLADVIDINTADAAAFERAMKGVGPAKAKAIVEYRTQHGSFKSVDDLLNVKGIGQKTLDNNRANLSVGGGAMAPATKTTAAGAKTTGTAPSASAPPPFTSSKTDTPATGARTTR